MPNGILFAIIIIADALTGKEAIHSQAEQRMLWKEPENDYHITDTLIRI